jgi:putative hydrolase of the HAD superfamily
MPIKALMVDIDGVIVVHPDPKGWSVNLERDLGLSPERLQETFFRPHFGDILVGRSGLHETLAPVLHEIAPHLSVERLVNYWFQADANFNHDLLDQLAAVRERGIALHVVTNQEHARANLLWRTLELRQRFDALHYAADLGCAKPSSKFFEQVIARSGFAPAETFLIDDRIENVEAAQNCGWQAALWTGRQRVCDLVKPDRCGSAARNT